MAEHISVADTAKKQTEMLDSFVNVRQYDMLLTYLEATLFQHLPRFHCPSSLVINILFTLATLSEYNNADALRKEFGNVSSERPVHVRALAVLESLVAVIKNREMHSQKEIDGAPNPLYIEEEDLFNAQEQIIHSLDFFSEKKGKGLRSRAFRTHRYTEKPADLFDEFTTSPPASPTTSAPPIEISPQKKQLQMILDGSADGNKGDDDDDDDDWASNIADKKSAQIIKNKRFDIALGEGKIFTAIQWALAAARSSQQVRREIWNMWRPIITIIIDILEVELESFEQQQKTEKLLFVDSTVTEAFFIALATHNWSTRFFEAIMPSSSDKVQKIFNNEGECAKSVHLVQIPGPAKGDILSSDAVPLLKKMTYLALTWARLRTRDIRPSVTGLSDEELYTRCSMRLFDSVNFNDMLYFFHFTEDEIADKTKSLFMFNALSNLLVQMTTYKFQDFVDPNFIFVEDTKNIEILFENITYKTSHYELKTEGVWGYNGFVLNYSRINLALFLLFNMWVYWTKPNLSTATKKKLLKRAAIGQKLRYDVLTSTSLEIDESELHHLTDLLELQLS